MLTAKMMVPAFGELLALSHVWIRTADGLAFCMEAVHHKVDASPGSTSMPIIWQRLQGGPQRYRKTLLDPAALQKGCRKEHIYRQTAGTGYQWINHDGDQPVLGILKGAGGQDAGHVASKT